MNPHVIDCIVCERGFRFGPNIYDGRYISSWGAYVCSLCDQMNHDGVAVGNHPGFLDRLRALNIDVIRNAKHHVEIPAR